MSTRKYVLDFDGTITQHDTISTLFSIALSLSKNPDLQGIHERIISEYTQDYISHVNSYTPSSENRHTLASELAFLRSLCGVEQRSFDRVSSSRILADVDFYRAGREKARGGAGEGEGEVRIRNGFRSFISMIEEKGKPSEWAILSVNFSRRFITGVVEETLKGDAEIETVKERKIISNSVDPQTGRISGPLSGKGDDRVMATCQDKRECLQELVEEWGVDLSEVVYVGDSTTDLECLIDIGTGIVVVNEEQESGLLKTLERISVQIVHISDFQKRDRDEKCLFWARDFGEIIVSGVLDS